MQGKCYPAKLHPQLCHSSLFYFTSLPKLIKVGKDIIFPNQVSSIRQVATWEEQSHFLSPLWTFFPVRFNCFSKRVTVYLILGLVGC